MKLNMFEIMYINRNIIYKNAYLTKQNPEHK